MVSVSNWAVGLLIGVIDEFRAADVVCFTLSQHLCCTPAKRLISRHHIKVFFSLWNLT